MYDLGARLHKQGKDGEAEQWLRRAAAAQQQGWFKGMNYWKWEWRGWEWSRSGGNKKIAEMGEKAADGVDHMISEKNNPPPH